MPTSLLGRVVVAVRHQWLIVLGIIAVGAVVAYALAHRAHPTYTATTMVLMVPEAGDASGSQTSATPAQPVLSTDLPSLATDTTVLSRLKKALGETASLETLRSRIRAKVNSESTLMPVQYTDRTAAAAIRGANTVGDEITRLYREVATTRFDSLIADFNRQLARRRVELTRLDVQLAAAAKVYPFVDISTGSSASGSGSVYQRLVAIHGERDSLRAAEQADGVMANAMGRLTQNAKPLAERDIIENDHVYRNLHDQYAKDYTQLSALGAFGTARYPGFVELRAAVGREAKTLTIAQRAALRRGLASNSIFATALDNQVRANALVESDKARLSELKQEEDILDAQIGRSGIATQVARIRRDHENAEVAYATIAGRLAKAIADRAEAASTGSVIVLDRAQFAPRSASASPAIIISGVLFLSVWLALTVAVMIESNQERFRDSVTIETIYGAPVIGSVV